MLVEKRDDSNVLAAHFLSGNKFLVRRVRDLSESEAALVDRDLDSLFAFDRHRQIISVVELNEHDLLEIIGKCAKKMPHGLMQPSTTASNDMFIEVNKGVLNLLSSLKTFLEFADTYLKRKYGDQSEQALSFKKEQSAKFDNNFSYRFCYKLRNYAQHCGLPVSGLETNTTHLSSTEMVSNFTLTLYRDQLLSAFTWGRHVALDLKRLPEVFDLKVHLDSFTNDVKQLCDTLIHLDFPSIKDSLQRISLLTQEVSAKHPDGKPVIYNLSANGKTYGDTFWLPIELISEIQKQTQ
jgi:hypothetical protein